MSDAFGNRQDTRFTEAPENPGAGNPVVSVLLLGLAIVIGFFTLLVALFAVFGLTHNRPVDTIATILALAGFGGLTWQLWLVSRRMALAFSWSGLVTGLLAAISAVIAMIAVMLVASYPTMILVEGRPISDGLVAGLPLLALVGLVLGGAGRFFLDDATAGLPGPQSARLPPVVRSTLALAGGTAIIAAAFLSAGILAFGLRATASTTGVVAWSVILATILFGGNIMLQGRALARDPDHDWLKRSLLALFASILLFFGIGISAGMAIYLGTSRNWVMEWNILIFIAPFAIIIMIALGIAGLVAGGWLYRRSLP